MDKRINPIQMLTWNHLKVNEAGEKFELAEVPEGGFTEPDTKVTADKAGILLEKDIQNDTVSAVGEYYDRYVTENHNLAYVVTADGDTGTVREDTTLTADQPAAVILTGIDAKQESSITLIQVLRSDEEVEGMSASLTKIRAGKDSRVQLIQVCLAGDRTRRWSAVSVTEEEGAKVDVIRVELGGVTSAAGSRSRLVGDGSHYTIKTVYFVDDGRYADLNDTAEFYGKETHADIQAAGVLSGTAHKVLRETVDFKRGAVHAVGHEGEDVVMFGEGSVNKTTPLILCGEEWVEGQHAAVTSRLDPKMLYYLESRGLSPAQAKRIMIDTKITPVTDLIPDEELRSQISDRVGRRLDLIDEFTV